MESSTRDDPEGRLHQVKGTIEEAAGRPNDSPKLLSEGKEENE